MVVLQTSQLIQDQEIANVLKQRTGQYQQPQIIAALASFTSTHNSGDVFPVGTTTVTYTATDIHGNTQTCSFTVTVIDNTEPTISGCPSNITVNTGSGNTQCSQTASWTAPTATDNCGIASFASSHNPGAAFPVGTTTVTYTATDVNGNTRNLFLYSDGD